MHLRKVLLGFLVIGFSISAFGAEEKRGIQIDESPYTTEGSQDGQIINLLEKYRDRRASIGGTVSIAASMYEPVLHPSNFFLGSDFVDIYDAAEVPFIKLSASLKWNMGLGSISADVAGGYYSNSGESDSSFSMTPLMLGGTLAFDTLTPEPLFVPFFSGGIALMYFKEEVGTQSFSGVETYGYYTAGLMVQLDWADYDGDFASYNENGIENTFVYVAGSGFIGTETDDSDFNSDPVVEGGIKVEF